MYQYLLTSTENLTLTITLNRPQVLNALNTTVLSELDMVLEAARTDDQVRGIILTGSGEKAFAAGADIGEFQGLDQNTGQELSRKGQELMARIEAYPKPIVAAVNGFALGGGCELAMSCHIRVAAENARFGQPEVKLGLVAGYGGTQRLVQLIGKAKAIELLITTDMLDANEAHRLGLVNYVTPQSDLLGKCEEILQKTYKQSPLAIALTLEAIYAGVNSEAGYPTESHNFGKSVVSEDGIEGATAFREKRAPNFTGK
ncbi:MAG: enoyl-CoA hydratase-related protein [Bacteroidota bacterium]